MRIATLSPAVILLAISPGAAAATSADRAFAILQKRCFACHADQASMSGLRLNSREGLLKGGTRGPAVIPGDPAKSTLWSAVTQSAKLAMPPDGKLPDADLATLRDWIAEGAPWPEAATTAAGAATPKWWAFQKVPPVETPKSTNPIDAFIQAKLAQSHLKPAPPADRLALLKRATFDLHGLPPTPEMVREFLDDQRPDAWPRLIDRLLDSRDTAKSGAATGSIWSRYGDTSGFEQDPYNLGRLAVSRLGDQLSQRR